MNDLKNATKIFTVSLDTKKKHKAYSVYTGEQIIVADIRPITGTYAQYRDSLRQEIEDRKKNGHICVVEEKTESFADIASPFDFEAMSEVESRVNLYVALDYYFSMLDQGNIVLPDEAQRHLIRESQVERLQDDKGRTKYSVNWEVFDGGKKCLLLAVMAAIYEPISARWLEGALEVAEWDRPVDPYAPIRAIEKVLVYEKQVGIMQKQGLID